MKRLLKSVGQKAAFAGMLLIAVMIMFAALFAITGEAPAALVVFPPDNYPERLPDDIRLLRWDDRTAVMTSENRDYVQRLYAAGALLVLPVRKNGCIAQRPTKK